jgi:DinB superfamily
MFDNYKTTKMQEALHLFAMSVSRPGGPMETTNSETDQALRQHLLYLTRGEGAHVSFDEFVDGFPAEQCNREIVGLPYTPWQVLEHMRLAQWDILEFSRNSNHVSPDFPKGYWPNPKELGNQKLWAKTVEMFRGDLKEMEELISNPSTDLFQKIPHGSGQTILREALLIADHNAYHLGALAVMKRLIR